MSGLVETFHFIKKKFKLEVDVDAMKQMLIKKPKEMNDKKWRSIDYLLKIETATDHLFSFECVICNEVSMNTVFLLVDCY